MNSYLYKNQIPPDYKIRNVIVPVMVFYGEDDKVIVPKDVEKLSKFLPNLVNMTKLPFSHNNFVNGRDAKYVYNIIIDSLFKYNRDNNKNLF